MAVKEFAWKGDPKVVHLPKKPSFEDLLPDVKAIGSAIDRLNSWQAVASGNVTQQTMADLKTIVDHFGYEPYEGKCYRGLSWPKNRPMPEAGKTVKLNVALRPYSSWTTRPEIARHFTRKKQASKNAGPRAYMAVRNHNEKYQGGLVVELQDKGLQIINMRYLEAVVAYMWPLIKSGKKELIAQMRAVKKSGDTQGYTKTRQQVWDLISLEVTLKRAIQRHKGWHDEDEVILKLKDKVRVKVIEVVQWDE